ncbi:unnamed protein product [Heterobilharzia americana]|nr:unnamed protein product [Heterobilharzia americana]
MIVCSVCTSHGASKLLFTHPRMMFDTTHVSALGNKKNVRYSFHQIKGLQPSAIRCATAFVHHLSGVSVFAYGLSTGSIIVARVPVLGSSITENTEVFELCQASMIQKLWCGITPFSSKTDNDSVSSPLDILSLSLGCDEYLLATICKDHRLRLWDLKHRNCFVMLDLLEILPKTHDVVLSSDQSVLRSSFAPGLCHRLSSSPASDHVINLVVYLSMCLSASSNSVNLDFASSEDVNSSYWCWMQLDVDKALNRNRDCLRVLQVEPLFQHLLRNVSNENSAQLWSYKSNMNSLLKMSRPDVSVLDFVPSEIKQKSETGSDSRENRKGSNSALGGIWWIAHQTNTGDTDLDSNYFVRWTEIKNSECDSNKYKRTISAFPPGVNLLQPLPNWHRIPEYLMQLSSQERTDSLWEETSVDAQLQIFLDYLFHPGCLSWFAITNAFKSLCESYALPDCDLVSTASNLHEMRVCAHRTLVDKVIPKLDRDGIGTMFKTFYSTAIDYHEHGLQPLGLLRIHTKTASTSSGQTMFPCEDTVVVIRRWGFSILRQLQDVEILLWNNIPPVVGRLQSSYSKTNTQAIIDLTTDCRKILHVLNEQPNWPKWESCLFDHIKSDLSPLLLVEQVIEQLDQINECWLPPPISSSVKFMSPFCTGSLSSSQLSAVTCLISLLDSYGTMEKSVQSLQSLFDMDASSTCYDMEITSQSWLNNNSRFSGERNSFNPLNRRSLLGDGGCSKFIESLSNSSVEFLRQSCCESTETRILFTFALLILIRRNELASNGLVMVCDRTDNSNIDDKDDDIEEKDININWHSTAKWRLVSLIRSLGFLRTLTVIRVRPTPDMDKLSIIRDHLNALGIHDLSLSAKQLDTSFKHSSSPHSPVIISQTPGMTIFEQIWFNWDWLKLCYSKTCTFPSSSDWLEFSHHILLEFSKLLAPTTDGGQGIVFVFWMLLWCGHPSELVKLCMLLLPPEDVFSKQRDIEDQDRILREPFTDLEAVKIAGECDSWTSQAADSDGDSRRISWWWEKDFSFIHLCIGLAKLWLGEPVPAKKHFIIATNWLYRYTQLFINNLLESSQPTSPLLSITAVSSVNQVPKLLIPILFPREFTLPKLFCLNRTSGCTGAVSAHSLSPDEVQIRFLMKLMSIFEVSNYVTEVLDLAEFCLNRLAESSQNLASLLENCSDQGSVIKSSRRLASVLASLRGIIENDDVNGFLCESNKLTNFVEYGIGSTADEAQSGIRARLADLEAALWTRMFKHELALGHYTKAYMILRSNPDVARRRDCLRQLVVTVCDRGEASKLVSFHYGPMENEFLAILEAKAVLLMLLYCPMHRMKNAPFLVQIPTMMSYIPTTFIELIIVQLLR